LVRLFLLLIIITVSISALAQPAGRYLFSQLDTRDGLLSNNVLAVQQDTKGYIWVGTGGGVQRYDGHRFLSFRYNPNNPNAFPEGAVHALQLDKQNRLWILFAGFKVGYIDITNLAFHEVALPVSDEVLMRSKGGMYMDNDGNLMVIIVGHGILTFKEKEKAFVFERNPFRLPNNWNVYYIWQDKIKNYWIGCDSGLVKYNTGRKTLSYKGHNTDNDIIINKMADLRTVVFAYVDNTNRFWIKSWPVTGLKIKSYDAGSNKLIEWQDIIGRSIQGRYYEMHGVTELQDGTIWLAGQNLFSKLSADRLAVESILSDLPGEYSIRFDNIHRIIEDREKNVWVASDKGLFRFNPSAQLFTPIILRLPGRDTIFTPDVTDILQTNKGEILVSTWGNGIFSFDNNFTPVRTPIAMQSTKTGEAMAWCLYQRANGDIWRGDQGGIIFIHHAKTNSTERIQDPVFEKSTIRQVTADKKGNLWFGTQKGYVIKWDAVTNKFSVQQKLESIIPRLITDNKGNIWVATEIKGIFKINSDDGRILSHYTAQGPQGKRLRANYASDIIQYNDTLFVIAANGLNFLNIKNDTVRYFSTADGLPTNDIFNLAKDKNDYIWMATSSGIVSFHLVKKKLSTYNASDGVHTTSFNTGSINLLKDGRIAIGTAHDLVVFNPAEVTVNEYTPPVVEITGFSLMNKSLPLDSLTKQKKIQLQYRQNSIAIDLSTLTYQNTYPVYYKMEGLDDEWIQVGKSNQATYSYLPPGNYTFKAGSKDETGKFGSITSMWFHINAPFWNTWWFYSLLALIIGAILFLFDRLRMQRLKEEQQIRSSIAGNLHEDVSTALQNINVLSEIASLKADKQPEQSKDFIRQIQQKSRNMVIAMSDVLWSVDPQNDSMSKTIERLHEVAHAMRNRHTKKVEVLTGNNVAGLKLSMKIRHELIIIYKLILVSLVEELQSPHTAVQLDYTKPSLQLRILSVAEIFSKGSNNTVDKHMAEIKKRAAMINAVLDIQSDEKGTEILLGIRV
jgi:ligand-binding sensor domain-containing protein